MTLVRAFEVAAWFVFWAGIVTLLVRGYVLRKRSMVEKFRTGWILAWTMVLSAPVFVVVYALAGLGMADTFFGDSGRKGPWFMVVTGAGLIATMPGALRRTRRGMAGHQ